jgi:hypothetical protein
MGKNRTFCFDGKTFERCESLTNYWNFGKKVFMYATPSTVNHKINNWERANPNKELTDDVYRQILTTRASLNAIKYKGQYYKGAYALYNELNDTTSITYKAFHLNYSNWRAENQGITPSNEQIESFIKSKRMKGIDGTRVSPNRLFWQNIPSPKIGWEMMATKIRKFTLKHGGSPSKKEMTELAKRNFEWLNIANNKSYKDCSGKPVSIVDFYNKFDEVKVTLNCFRQRVYKAKSRSNSLLTINDATELIKPYGCVTNVYCILYQWKHKTTKMPYIGATTQTLKERNRGHVRDSKKDNINPLSLEDAIARDGVSSFDITILDRFNSVEELVIAEIRAIAKSNSLSPNGYNLHPGGCGIGLITYPIEHDKENYKNMTAIAVAYDIPVKRLESRLRWGWCLSDALSLPKGSFVDSSFSKLGLETLSQLAKKYNIPYKKVWERIVKQKWTLNESLEISPRFRPQGTSLEVTVSGLRFRSERKAAIHFGIPEGTWRKRKSLGWTPEQRANLIPRLSNKKHL